MWHMKYLCESAYKAHIIGIKMILNNFPQISNNENKLFQGMKTYPHYEFTTLLKAYVYILYNRTPILQP